MPKIAFLGLGAMGARMAARLIDAGYEVAVWNRKAEKAEGLVERGARLVASPAEAARGAELVFAMVRDDVASRAVWLDPEQGALRTLAPGAIGVDCSTLSVPHVKDLAEAFAVADRGFLEAPLAGSRPQAEAGQLIFLTGGEAAALEAVQPALEVLGGAVHHAGPAGAGAVLKLMVNVLFAAQLAALGELLAFAEKSGVPMAGAMEILGAVPVCSPAAKPAGGAMVAGNFAPAFPIDLVVKDFGLAVRSAEKVTAAVPLTAAVEKIYQDAVAAGYAGDNITGVIQAYRG